MASHWQCKLDWIIVHAWKRLLHGRMTSHTTELPLPDRPCSCFILWTWLARFGITQTCVDFAWQARLTVLFVADWSWVVQVTKYVQRWVISNYRPSATMIVTLCNGVKPHLTVYEYACRLFKLNLALVIWADQDHIRQRWDGLHLQWKIVPMGLTLVMRVVSQTWQLVSSKHVRPFYWCGFATCWRCLYQAHLLPVIQLKPRNHDKHRCALILTHKAHDFCSCFLAEKFSITDVWCTLMWSNSRRYISHSQLQSSFLQMLFRISLLS